MTIVLFPALEGLPADSQQAIVLRGALKAFWARMVDENGLEMDPPCSMAPDEWFPGKGETGAWAREVCLTLCPASEECAIMATLAGERDGIWGGVTARELRRREGRALRRSGEPPAA